MHRTGFPLLAPCLGDLIDRELDRAVMIRPPEFLDRVKETMREHKMIIDETTIAAAYEQSDLIARDTLGEMFYTCVGMMGQN